MEETILILILVCFIFPQPQSSLYSSSPLRKWKKGKGTHIREGSWACLSGHSEISSLSPKLSGRNYDWVHFDEVFLISSITSEKEMHKIHLFKMLSGKPFVSDSRVYRTVLLQMVFNPAQLCQWRDSCTVRWKKRLGFHLAVKVSHAQKRCRVVNCSPSRRNPCLPWSTVLQAE